MKSLNEYINDEYQYNITDEILNEGWLGKLFGNIFGAPEKVKEIVKNYTKEEKAAFKAVFDKMKNSKLDKAKETLQKIQKAKEDKKKQLKSLMNDIKTFAQDDETKNTPEFASFLVFANKLAADLKDNNALEELKKYAKDTNSKTQKEIKEIIDKVETEASGKENNSDNEENSNNNDNSKSSKSEEENGEEPIQEKPVEDAANATDVKSEPLQQLVNKLLESLSNDINESFIFEKEKKETLKDVIAKDENKQKHFATLIAAIIKFLKDINIEPTCDNIQKKMGSLGSIFNKPKKIKSELDEIIKQL